MKEVVIGFVAVVAVSSLMMLGASWLADMGCEARWRDSGIKSNYSLTGGCRVQRTDGTWVPASTIRDLGQ
jgi:hypothetical protein